MQQVHSFLSLSITFMLLLLFTVFCRGHFWCKENCCGMEGHDERGGISVFGQPFHPYPGVHITPSIIVFSEFKHFAAFRKAQIFGRLQLLPNSRLLKLPLQSSNRVFIRKQIRCSKTIGKPLISMLIDKPFFLKRGFSAMLQDILQIQKISADIQFTLNSRVSSTVCSLHSVGINRYHPIRGDRSCQCRKSIKNGLDIKLFTLTARPPLPLLEK